MRSRASGLSSLSVPPPHQNQKPLTAAATFTARPPFNTATRLTATQGHTQPVPRIRALRGIGEASLALDDAAGARAPLERALELQLRIEDDPQGLAKTLYLLARALASSPRDRERAIGLGLAAHFVALSNSARGEESVQEIGDWLAATSRAMARTV